MSLHQGGVASWAPPEAISHPGGGISSVPSGRVWRGPGTAALGPCAEPGSARRGGAGRRGVDLGFSAIQRLFFLTCLLLG